MSLKLDNISKRFGADWVFRNVSLEVEPGTVFGLFGVKGCGKTTLLRIIAGLDTADGGSLTLDDDSQQLSPSDKRVGFVPNAPVSSFWQRTVGGKRLDTVDIAERQTQAIRTELANEHTLTLLDDPFSFLDKRTTKEIFREIREKAASSDSLLIVTSNDVEDLYNVCDKIAIIEDGEIVQVDRPETLYEDPKTIGVSEATGRINLFEARRLTSSKADLPEFQTIAGGHRLFAKRKALGDLGAINQNATLAIRPEHISISFGASFPEDNLLKATIANVRFLGATTLIELDCDGLKVSALVLRLVGLNQGDECMVGLPPDRIRVLTK